MRQLVLRPPFLRPLAVRLILAAMLAVAGPGGMAARAAGPTEGAAPPYDEDFMRLAEILGALHYLRPLCGIEGEAQRWRSEMQALIDAEQPSEERRVQMIASFNRGYSSYAQVYLACTASARLAVSRQLEEAGKLAHDIVVRFGGN